MSIKLDLSLSIRIILWIVLLVGGLWLGLRLDRSYFLAFQTPFFRIVSFLLGVVVFKLSLHAAAVGGRALAKYGRVGNIPRGQTNRLVTEDIYSCTRHPMLFGLVLLPLALALLMGSPSFIFLIAPIEGVIIALLMIIFDEMESRMKFGKEFEEYRKKTPIFPRTTKCYKKLFIDS